MRYNVGEVYAFAQTTFDDNGNWGLLYDPRVHSNLKIDVVTLKCIKHERVPGNWDDKIKYDGFIFEQVGGEEPARIWYNQYPRASYGQLDDSNDRRVVRHFTQEESERILDRTMPLGESNKFMEHYTDVLEMLGSIHRAITGNTRSRLNLTPDGKAKFEEYENTLKKLAEEKLGKKITFEELVIEYLPEANKLPHKLDDYWIAKANELQI